ncbi:VanW family protein [Anaerosalibacter massiliensis]|uniref:VanW family protein n=1 Tax=Anaerosalibacter massiliensis TaxID=1347392 RepID=A0A9X2MHA2_9FIRM|nr:VanW family protein [Anaerosalibacter massiliensis]MCR2043137.1 VanW family protein [Anaerosalibacter massiliensis]
MERTRKEDKKNIQIILYLSIAIVLFSIGFYGFYLVLSKETMYEGIKVEKINLSNMTKEEALKHIKKNKEESLTGKKMVLKFKDKSYNIELKDLGFYYDYEKAINKAYSIGRKGNIFARLKTISNTKKHGENIELKSGYDVKAVEKLVNKISEDINLESKNAVFHFNQGNMSVTEERIGRKVNKELLKEKIEGNIYKLEDIDIPVDNVNPKITKAQLNRINGIIGEFSTSFKNSSKDRKENIRISAKALDGRIVMPGEVFSFNESTGPRSKQKGYKEANIIVKGEFVPGLGGGVCQVSTTLYNALLLSNLNVTERHPHSLPVKYVPENKDAAVSYGSLDLKFKNDFDYPVYIHTKANEDHVYIYIYGNKKK